MGGEYPLHLLLLIPVIGGLIGWITNVVAVKMMFKPDEFVGIKPPLGWQGVIPAHAVNLAKTGLKLVMSQVLAFRDLFEGIKPEDLVAPYHDRLRAMTEEVVRAQASERFGPMWDGLGAEMQSQIIEMAYGEVVTMSHDVVDRLLDSIEELVDIQEVVVESVRRDPALMGNLFEDVGAAEFVFIRRSGLYFGFLFGLIQLAVWVIYPVWWILPFFGFLVGYGTNWVAIKLIFEPREPKKILMFQVQGLFHRRQKEVSIEFGNVVANNMLNNDNLFAELTRPAARTEILKIVEEAAERLVERYRDHPLAKGLMTEELIESVRTQIMTQVEAELFREDGMLTAIAHRSDQIRTMLQERMSVMESEAFENVLRPAFKRDEWKLILAGAILGLGAGTLQLVYLFGEALASGYMP